MLLDAPNAENDFQREQAQRLIATFKKWIGRDLIALEGDASAQAEALFNAPFAVVSHGKQSDPIFNYGNRTALGLFEMTWEEFTAISSRLSAEPVHRDERQRLMERVRDQGFIDDYRGVRISKNGRRFLIENAIVWNVVDEAGALTGQAAMFAEWTLIEK